MSAAQHDFLTANYARYPVEFARGSGATLWDEDGEAYLDFLCGISVSNVGHCHPAVVEAIQRQAGELIHVGNLFYTRTMVALAERLARGSLGDEARVFFTNSGAEAVEAALKLARKAKRGGDVVSLQRAFHGRTYGALSATPQEAKQAPFAPLVPGFRAVAPTAEAIRASVDASTAAVILEPVQGEGGIFVLDEEVLVAAREACDEHGACLIFDEIQCGMARCGGSLWRFQQTSVVPDVLLAAKSLAGGLPMGALVAGPAYADVYATGDHGSTFPGGLVVSAAAHAALDVLEDGMLQARVTELGELARALLAELPGVAGVRGVGLMNAVDLVEGGAPDVVRRALLEERLVANATGPQTIRLLPPLVVGEEELREGIVRLGRALAA